MNSKQVHQILLKILTARLEVLAQPQVV